MLTYLTDIWCQDTFWSALKNIEIPNQPCIGQVLHGMFQTKVMCLKHNQHTNDQPRGLRRRNSLNIFYCTHWDMCLWILCLQGWCCRWLWSCCWRSSTRFSKCGGCGWGAGLSWPSLSLRTPSLHPTALTTAPYWKAVPPNPRWPPSSRSLLLQTPQTG